MDTKLTLKLDREVIEKTRRYAKKKNLSLSEMVERYFRSLSEKSDAFPISPLVKELSGVIDLSKAGKMSAPYEDYLEKKYRR